MDAELRQRRADPPDGVADAGGDRLARAFRGGRAEPAGLTARPGGPAQLGEQDLPFVGGPLQIRQVSDRLAGARQEVEKHPGVSLEVVPVDALTVLEGRRAGEELVRRSAERRPDAVFAANDLVAVGLLQGLFINGRIRIPEDISLVGYDDIMFASASVVPLTSIRQPSALIGRTGVEILIEEAQDPEREPRHVLYQPELVVRGSSSAEAVE